MSYFNGDQMAEDVWKGKYAMSGEKSPDDMHNRMAEEFAKIEQKYPNPITKEKIFEAFSNFKYIVPQGSIMYGLGRNLPISLSNCFVIDSAKDSYGGILHTDQQQVQLMKRRGGVGHDISNLRPSGTSVNNSAESSTGAVSFMERFSNSTRETAQNGRRGALMLSIDINHPDVEQFATVKSDLNKVTGANISIKLNDEFMKAVENDKDYILRFPCEQPVLEGYEPEEYNTLVEIPEGGVYLKKVKAKELWNTITEQARNNAEPGLMFWDNVMNMSPDGVYDEYRPISSNPCGEQFLQAYDSCRLMCLNLYSFVENPFTKDAYINYDKLYEMSYMQQKLMDDLVDLEIEYINKIISKIENDPETIEIKKSELDLWKKIKDTASNGRRTGSGITALGDMLAALGIKYGSNDSKKIINNVMKHKLNAELSCQVDMAEERGCFVKYDPFLEFNIELTEDGFSKITSGKNDFYDYILKEFPDLVTSMISLGRRNISWSTIAPTGSVSILCQTTSGCEPIFMPFYMRRKKINPNDENAQIDFVDDSGDSWQEYPVLHQKFEQWCNMNFDYQGGENISEKEYYEKAFKKSPWYESTANDINWKDRLEIQSILQKNTTNAISSTLNLPEETTVEEVKNIYEFGHKNGLKGVTIYRDGSRSGVLVKEKDEFSEKDAVPRPEVLDCDIYYIHADGKKWTTLVGIFKGKPYEIFVIPNHAIAGGKSKGKIKKKGNGKYDLILTGVIFNFISKNISDKMDEKQSAITRLTSSLLRHRTNVKHVIEQLDKSYGTITSFTTAISRTLKNYLKEEDLIKNTSCQNCGSSNLIMEEGCLRCVDCGSSKCG